MCLVSRPALLVVVVVLLSASDLDPLDILYTPSGRRPATEDWLVEQ